MVRKLNLLGKIVVISIVVLIALGVYFGGKFVYTHVSKDFVKYPLPQSTATADDLAGRFLTAVNSRNYTDVFDMLASTVPKSATADMFGQKLAEKFTEKLNLEGIVTKGDKALAVFSVENKSEYVILPLVKENSGWRINSFADIAKCTDKCTSSSCKDDKTLVTCEDTNNDTCKEEVTKTCEVVCSNGACTTKKENFVLKQGDVITTFSKNVQLFLINKDGSVTLNVGDDIYEFEEGDMKVIGTLKITVMNIESDSVSLKIVE